MSLFNFWTLRGCHSLQLLVVSAPCKILILLSLSHNNNNDTDLSNRLDMLLPLLFGLLCPLQQQFLVVSVLKERAYSNGQCHQPASMTPLLFDKGSA